MLHNSCFIIKQIANLKKEEGERKKKKDTTQIKDKQISEITKLFNFKRVKGSVTSNKLIVTGHSACLGLVLYIIAQMTLLSSVVH